MVNPNTGLKHPFHTRNVHIFRIWIPRMRSHACNIHLSLLITWWRAECIYGISGTTCSIICKHCSVYILIHMCLVCKFQIHYVKQSLYLIFKLKHCNYEQKKYIFLFIFMTVNHIPNNYSGWLDVMLAFHCL